MDDKVSLLNQLRIDRREPVRVQRPRWAWWAAAGVVVLLVAGGAWILAAPSGIPIHAAVAREAVSEGNNAGASLLDASGYVVARRQATVAGKITDKVVEVLIEEGQHVEKDEVIARLDNTNTMAALEQAQAQVLQAQANLVSAKTAFADAEPIYRRNKKLVAEGWLSVDAFDNSQAAYDQARNNLAVAERALAVAQKGLEVAQRAEDDTIIRAPFAGVVTVKAAQPGEVVSPLSTGGFTRTGIGTIVDMDSLEVEVDVSENFINRVHAAQQATVRLNAYPDWQIPAYVIAIIPTADRSKATVKVRVGFKVKDQRLVPEMGARVSFLSDVEAKGTGKAAQPGVIVPVDAVQANGDTGVVYVIHNGTVERRAVRLGARTADGQTIVAGLATGAQVATGDLSKLSDGSRVKVEQE
ncbi:MAG TPA: efflux RND transporter periplasmic adaptor subunit [Alphaproteobacteria bacterium]|nr:efflux RND transporter periplasmic adaptor subunit [Alphaproteobacteria bacterium]